MNSLSYWGESVWSCIDFLVNGFAKTVTVDRGERNQNLLFDKVVNNKNMLVHGRISFFGL